jgi:hypothetical protein
VRLSEQIPSGPTNALQTPSKVMAITPARDKIFLLTTAGLTVAELDAVPLGNGALPDLAEVISASKAFASIESVK